jgi:type I site-specific restriction endonuclease
MPRKISEDRTRKEMIDPQLETAGWYLRDHAEERAKVKIEITACPALFAGWMDTMRNCGMG